MTRHYAFPPVPAVSPCFPPVCGVGAGDVAQRPPGSWGRCNTPLSPPSPKHSWRFLAGTLPAMGYEQPSWDGPYAGQFGVIAARAGAGAVEGGEGPHATGGGGRLGPVYQPLTRYLQHIPDRLLGIGESDATVGTLGHGTAPWASVRECSWRAPYPLTGDRDLALCREREQPAWRVDPEPNEK